MPRFRIHRMKDAPGENFRWSAHTGGLSIAKPKDYLPAGEVDCATPYAAWKLLAAEGRPLHPGDVLEVISGDGASGELQIAKYIGFEPAKWYVAELKSDTALPPGELSAPEDSFAHSS